MYSNAKPLRLARSARQPSESSSGAARLAADHHVGARQPDAEPRVGVTLHEQAAALRPVGERLAHRAVHPPAEAVEPLQHRHLPAEHRLRHAVLRAALHRDVHAVDVERAQALAADRAALEAQRGRRVARPAAVPRCARASRPRFAAERRSAASTAAAGCAERRGRLRACDGRRDQAGRLALVRRARACRAARGRACRRSAGSARGGPPPRRPGPARAARSAPPGPGRARTRARP